MSDLKSALERETERFDLPAGALNRMLERRRSRQRRQRLAVMALAVAISVGIGGAMVSLGGLRTRGVTSQPTEAISGASSISRLQGTWQTGRLSQRQIVHAFVRAGGSRREGRAFFSRLGHGTTTYAIITLRFAGRSLVEFERGDGGPTVTGYGAQIRETSDGTLTFNAPGCTGSYRMRTLRQQHLRLHVTKQCAGHDGPYNTTLFASFWFTKTA